MYWFVHWRRLQYILSRIIICLTQSTWWKRAWIVQGRIAMPWIVMLVQKLIVLLRSPEQQFSNQQQIWNKRTFDYIGDVPVAKTNQKVLDETENLTSTKGGFCRMNQCVATYEQTKEEFSYFYPIWIVEANASHILPLQFWIQRIRVNTSKTQPLANFLNFYSTFLLSVTQWKTACFLIN